MTDYLSQHRLISLCDIDTHRAPAVPFTVAEAHAIMQIHLECQAFECARKAAAFQVLVEAGRLKPDAGRGR